MRIQEISGDYFERLKADAQNLLMTAMANGEAEIDTESLIKELNQMGYNVTASSIGDLFKDSKMVKSVNPQKIVLQKDNNLTQYSKDATMDNEKTVAKMAKKTIDRDIT